MRNRPSPQFSRSPSLGHPHGSLRRRTSWQRCRSRALARAGQTCLSASSRPSSQPDLERVSTSCSTFWGWAPACHFGTDRLPQSGEAWQLVPTNSNPGSCWRNNVLSFLGAGKLKTEMTIKAPSCKLFLTVSLGKRSYLPGPGSQEEHSDLNQFSGPATGRIPLERCSFLFWSSRAHN